MPEIFRFKRDTAPGRPEVTVWVDLDTRDETTADWIGQDSGLSAEVAQRLLAPDEVSHREIFDDGMLICFHTRGIAPRADDENASSLRMWVDEERIITVHSHDLPSAEAVRAAAAAGEETLAPLDVLAWLIRGDLRQSEEPIARIVGETGDLEDRILAADDERSSEELSDLLRRIIQARRHLVEIRNLLGFINADLTLNLSAGERRALDSAANHVRSHLESLEDCHERSLLLKDHIEGRMADRLNRITYNLTIVATVFLPLSFLTGLLGMNVAGIPDEHDPRGFVIVCVVMVLIAFGSWAILRWRRWI